MEQAFFIFERVVHAHLTGLSLVDAKTAHLAKFSAGYKNLYPFADQIVIASYADIWVLPKFIIVRLLFSFTSVRKSERCSPRNVAFSRLQSYANHSA